MRKHQFGKRSRKAIDTCHPDLQLIFEESLKVSMVDFGVTEGHRPIELQQQYFREGKSKIDGVNKKGKHNLIPSEAGDIYVFVPGKPKLAYNATYLAYVGGVISATANRLYQEGRISHRHRWGYNWDGDGEIGTDQTFQDLPHHEIIKP